MESTCDSEPSSWGSEKTRLDLSVFSMGRSVSAISGWHTTRKRVKLCLLSSMLSSRIFMPCIFAASRLQIAAHPLHPFSLIYCAEPAVSSASTAFIWGTLERYFLHCMRATGWECTSVIVDQSSSGRQQIQCEMCSLCSPTTEVPESRSNS